MGGFNSRAILLAVLFLLSSQLYFFSDFLVEDESPLYSSQDDITSTEVRIHNLGGVWSENQVLEWSPNHLEYNRTIQFSILIEGISSTENIESMTLNMTWIYNVSTGDPLLSENLSTSDLVTHENGLFMYFNYTYPLDIFHDEYQITLVTIEADGTTHSFEHKGINVVAYDMHLALLSSDFDSRLLFANSQITSLEIFVQNTGSVYTDIEFNITLLTQLPSNWSTPSIFILDTGLSGGENSVVLMEFETPNGAFPSKYPMPMIEFQLTAEFEDFTGQMVEFYNVNYSLESELVPVDSSANISVYRTDYGTDLITNNFIINDPNTNIIEYSLVSYTNESIEFFFEIQNYGFTRSTFELEVSSQNSIEFEIYSVLNDGRALDLSGEQGNIRDVEPLDFASFKCQITLIDNAEISKDPISIEVTNSGTGTIFNLDIPIYILSIDNIVTPTVNMDDFEDSSNISISQNESLSMYLAVQWYPIFGTSYFVNNWNMDLAAANSDSDVETEIILNLVENNSSLTTPYNFNIVEGLFFECIIQVGEEVPVGNYSIAISIEQNIDQNTNKLAFESQIQMTILENSSLTEPNQNNSNNNSTTNNSNNNSTNNSTTDNSTTNNSDGSSNNTSNDISNSTGNNSQGSTNATTDGSQQNGDGNSEVPSDDSDDTAKSQNPDTKAWFFISFVLILITIISVIAIRRNISPRKESVEEAQNKTVAEINLSSTPAASTEEASSSDLTVLHQWTDNNGYTWKQMSDRSMLWWNGKEWVPVNYN